jgi:hypothetical protein
LDSDFGAGATLFSSGSSSHYVVATDKNGWAYALNGTKLYAGPVWKDQNSVFPGQTTCNNFQAPGLSISPGAYDGTSLYLGSVFTTNNGTSVQGTVRSVNPTTGAYIWNATTDGTVSAGIATGNGLVVAASRWYHVLGPDSNHCYHFFGTNESWLQVFNASSGNQLFSYYFGFPVVCAPTIADGRIFVGATINSTTSWNTQKIHSGHLYAFGLLLRTPTQVHPEVSPTLGEGILAYGNATGGMPSYGSMGWVWGDGHNLGGHGGLHYYSFSPTRAISVSFSVIDATGSQAGALWKVYVLYTTCGPGGTAICIFVIANLCFAYSFFPCYYGPVPITLYAGNVSGITGHITGWSWSFGDGSGQSTAPSPSYLYASHGMYTVTLTMTDNEHNQYTASTQISA